MFRRFLQYIFFAGLYYLSGCKNHFEKVGSLSIGNRMDTIISKQKPDTSTFPAATAAVPGYDSLRHTKKVKEVKTGTYDIVLVGNSLIHTLGEYGGRFKTIKTVWLKHFQKRKALNLGYSGYRTENIIWNLQNGELEFNKAPKVFVLLIGTNNMDDRRFKHVHTPDQVFQGTSLILDLIKKRCPNSKIILMRLFPRGGDDEKGIGKTVFHSSKKCIENTIQAGLLTKKLADDQSVFWLDVGKVFIQPNGKINASRMPDLLHPNEAGAEAWLNEHY